MTRKLSSVAPTGVAFRVRTVHYSTHMGAGRIRVEVHVEGVGKVQQLTVPYEHAARDPHRFAIQSAFGPNALDITRKYLGRRAFPNVQEWRVSSSFNNYAVVNNEGALLRWFRDGNDAIDYRDAYDHHNRDPRFSSSVLTSGQYPKAVR